MESTTSSVSVPDTKGVKINECCICYYTYNSSNRAPLSLPCGHTFCKQCTKQMKSILSIKCATCRKVLHVGIKDAPKNYALIQTLENFNLLASDDTVENIATKAVKLNDNVNVVPARRSNLFNANITVSEKKDAVIHHFDAPTRRGSLSILSEQLQSFIGVRYVNFTPKAWTFEYAHCSNTVMYVFGSRSGKALQLYPSLSWKDPQSRIPSHTIPFPHSALAYSASLLTHNQLQMWKQKKSTISYRAPEFEGAEISECCICCYTYNRTNRVPLTTHCGHTFCKSCIERMTMGILFSCAICRANSCSGFGLNPMPKNLTLIETLKNFNLLSDDIGEIEDTCEIEKTMQSILTTVFLFFVFTFIMLLPSLLRSYASLS
uniref:RING-type domain-containing protein n=1 Tax=Panagrellus redivivus TaxID=6233 RepID=A0A7E4UZP3_PANRE